VAYADEIVGRLLRYLKTHQLYDRSTIVLSAAHGEGLGNHGEAGHGLFVYEEALRVPLMIFGVLLVVSAAGSLAGAIYVIHVLRSTPGIFETAGGRCRRC